MVAFRSASERLSGISSFLGSQPRDRREPTRPRWAMMVGAILIVLGVLFLMALVFLAIFDEPVPCDSRWLVGVLLALLLAGGSGFLGTNAAMSSHRVSISNHPVAFSVTGGVVVFILVLGVFTHLVPACLVQEKLTLVGATSQGTEAGQLLLLAFDSPGVVPGHKLVVDVAEDSDFGSLWLTSRPLDKPEQGRAMVSTNRSDLRGCVRLRLMDIGGNTIEVSNGICFKRNL